MSFQLPGRRMNFRFCVRLHLSGTKWGRGVYKCSNKTSAELSGSSSRVKIPAALKWHTRDVQGWKLSKQQPHQRMRRRERGLLKITLYNSETIPGVSDVDDVYSLWWDICLPGSSFPTLSVHGLPHVAALILCFWPRVMKVPQRFHSSGGRTVQCGWKSKTKCFSVWNHSVHILPSIIKFKRSSTCHEGHAVS